ncbi:hypothetical protein BRADI_3g00066v3 [Brachypodium distachyon]|uniref:Uncharacterized protein n=1 Tax=Brachypodium distachyon TaxID=15368 RepID=A0A2K2CUF6_BRADI|nr:hypothetical protein BRADI_3g00066v3 [Brachypodium distachyon]
MAQPSGGGEGGGGQRGGGRGAGGVGVVVLPHQVRKMFFGDVSEIRESMMQYVLQQTPAVTLVPVSGDCRSYLKRSSRARRSTDALVKWFCHLHDLGYALAGSFNRDSFGIDQMGCLRGMTSLLPLVRTISSIVDGVKNNMAIVAAIIENGIHASLQIPQDLTHLLDGLKNYPIGFSLMVQSHICHEEEDNKTALFVRMYKRLKVLEKIDPAKHGQILQSIQQISGTNLWLASAMSNTHLHCVLRYSPLKRKAKRNMTNLVARFLRTKVQYTDDLDGFLTCRRNGQAHIESDSSVDMIGYMEAAIFGAAAGLNTYHQLQYSDAVAAAVQPVEPLATRLLKPVPLSVAYAIEKALETFLLSGAPLSLNAAKVGAAAAANYIVNELHGPTARIAQSLLLKNAVAAASGAAHGVQGGAAQVNPPLEMFDADDIDHIYDIVAPKLMVGFHIAMFRAGESFRLGNDTKIPRLE